MNLPALDGLVFFILSLLLFLGVQRWLHREMQAVFLLITRSPTLALGIFSLIFFPGVLLHELSHLLMAWILRVPTGKFSLIPQVQPNGMLRLGYVETKASDPLRETLIGTAPLLTGAGAVAFIGVSRLGLIPLTELAFQGEWGGLIDGLGMLPGREDFWMWFYLAFAISSTMLPSASDRRAWGPVILVIVLASGLALLAGAGEWMLANLMPPLNEGLRTLALIFSAGLILHFFLAVPTGLLQRLISRVTGMRVV